MKQMKITTSSGKMFSAEEVEAQKQALLREVLEKKVDLYRHYSGEPYTSGYVKGLSNIYHSSIRAVPVEAIQALMEGKK
jgi:hypothetical protein